MGHDRSGRPISFSIIDGAVQEIYGGWNQLPEESLCFIQSVIAKGDYALQYQRYRMGEQENKAVLLAFDETHPSAMKQEDIDDILCAAKARKSRRNDEHNSR